MNTEIDRCITELVNLSARIWKEQARPRPCLRRLKGLAAQRDLARADLCRLLLRQEIEISDDRFFHHTRK